MNSLKERLDREVNFRNRSEELSYDKPDPLLVASRYRDERVALICALFAYGNARQIVKFLDSLDFSLLNGSEEEIREGLSKHYYRFQTSHDITALFIALKQLKEVESIENIFYHGYRKSENILDGLWNFITTLRKVYPYESRGYNFLIGKVPKNINRAGTYKRYLMFLRWMVRDDNLDMGLWRKIAKKDLIIPLDTHTFQVSLRLGLLKRRTYDMKASLELTENLKKFDKNDPIRYDFAIYRLGRENLA